MNHQRVESRSLNDVKIGDTLIRVLGANGIPMPVIVGKIEDGLIYVGSADGVIPWEEGWTFDQKTGAEVDELLGWSPDSITGSYIVEKI